MKLTKQALKQIIKEELEDVMGDITAGKSSKTRPMAYFNQSMQDRVELQYDGKRVDFMYSYAGRHSFQVKQAIQSLANQKGKTFGSIPNLSDAILYYLEEAGMREDLPTLEQLNSMPVIFG